MITKGISDKINNAKSVEGKINKRNKETHKKGKRVPIRERKQFMKSQKKNKSRIQDRGERE